MDDFDFDLPASSIALRPVSPRDEARLLEVKGERDFSHGVVRDLPRLMKAGDLLVLNDTKVLPAELSGVRVSRGEGLPVVEIGLTLMERLADGRWTAFAKRGRRLREGDRIAVGGAHPEYLIVSKKLDDGLVEVAAEEGSVEGIMMRFGRMPLPFYISKARPADEQDATDYQTVYATHEGAVAAPTAGLHFTPEVLSALTCKGIATAFVTLHVGAGTFLPVKTENVADHEMHAEWFQLSEDTADAVNRTRAKGGRIVAVGTTSLRALESAAAEDGTVRASSTSTRLFIKPGFQIRVADMLLTNFHLPRSTLFMLVCAFAGTGTMKAAYAHAIASGFRFYSYGDACLLHREGVVR